MSVLSDIFGTNSSMSTNDSNAINNYNQVFGQQQDLAKQLQLIANGNGPNPYATMLQNSMGQNAQQAQGVYANNRAINPALAARQAGQAQTDANLKAANSAASLTQQQQLGAYSALGGLYNQMGNQANQNYGVGAGVAAGNQQQQGQIVGGLLGGAGAAMGGGGKAHGGMIEGYAEGGEVSDSSMPSSFAAKFLSGFGQMNPTGTQTGGPLDISHGMMGFAGASNNGYAVGGMTRNMQTGGNVPGKANVPGDSYKNDTVPAMLSPGEIVIPRHIVQGKNAPAEAAKFVRAALAHKKSKGVA